MTGITVHAISIFKKVAGAGPCAGSLRSDDLDLAKDIHILDCTAAQRAAATFRGDARRFDVNQPPPSLGTLVSRSTVTNLILSS